MLTIINNENDPYYNLALEEWLLKSGDAPDALVWLWQNRPAVIVGRHQNATEEVNLALTEARGIDVVRRISGGGAVYHDFETSISPLSLHSGARPRISSGNSRRR